MRSNCFQEIVHFCNLLHFVVSLHYANPHGKRMEGNAFLLGQTMRLRHCRPPQMLREKTGVHLACALSHSLRPAALGAALEWKAGTASVAEDVSPQVLLMSSDERRAFAADGFHSLTDTPHVHSPHTDLA